MYHYYLANIENPWIWIAIVLIALLLFGGSKIPEMMKGLAGGLRTFKKELREDSDDDELDKANREEKEREARIRAQIEEERDAKMKARIEDEMRREDEARRSKGVS